MRQALAAAAGSARLLRLREDEPALATPITPLGPVTIRDRQAGSTGVGAALQEVPQGSSLRPWIGCAKNPG